MKWYEVFTISLCLLLIASLEMSLARNANKRFMNCCNRKRNTNEWCKMKLCTFNITSNQALAAYPLCTQMGNTMFNIWKCANANKNHRKCCTRKRVPSKCQSYCSGKSKSNMMEPTCFYYYDRILSCFKEYHEKQ